MLKIKRMLKNTKKPLFYSTNYKKKYYFILKLFKNGRLLILSNTVKFFIDCLLFFRERNRILEGDCQKIDNKKEKLTNEF